MKRCTKCEQELPFEDFAPNKRDRYDSMCRPCRRAYQNAWYRKTGARRREQINACNARRIKRSKERIAAYLSSHPCVDCGEKDIIVLEFDHVRGKKVGNIADLWRHSAWNRVAEEIEKCDVRCANCHRRITHTRRWAVGELADPSGSGPEVWRFESSAPSNQGSPPTQEDWLGQGARV
jgi:hypothetical protein